MWKRQTPADVFVDAEGLAVHTLRLKAVELSCHQIPWKLARIWLDEKLSKMLVR
jgi:hypothetical protein